MKSLVKYLIDQYKNHEIILNMQNYTLFILSAETAIINAVLRKQFKTLSKIVVKIISLQDSLENYPN